MTPSKPYVIRAFYEWIADNNMTPYITIDAGARNIKAPMQYVKDGQITFNISMQAALKLEMNNNYITFSSRFGGVLMPVMIPAMAVLAIYARETGEGMVFPHEEYDEYQKPEEKENNINNTENPDTDNNSPKNSRKFDLKIIK